tara:strand:- start:7078 stop:7530 length:453 start_codon:yes stop_codon:yes gene_type:complete
MATKSYKDKKRGAGRHVQLLEWVMQTEAWSTMPMGPRCLYVELKRRFTGSNNGEIKLSHREAAALLCVSKNTIGGYFRHLEERGFIEMRQAPHLGPSGIGLTAHWLLTECAGADMKPAKMTFAKWRSEKKAPPRKRDTSYQPLGQSGAIA